MKAAFIPNIRNVKQFQHFEILDILNDIKTGKYKNQIDALRKSTDYKADKIKLPAWSFAGTFGDSVSNNGFLESNGLFHVDIDNIDDAEHLKRGLIHSCPELFALWISPSGKGLKGLLRIPDDFIHNDADFKKAFLQIKQYFLDWYGVTIDESCKDVRRLCFVCYDSELYLNENAPAFLFDVEKWNYEPEQAINKPSTNHQQTTKKHTNKEELYIDWCVNILRRAGKGDYHNARLRAGRLAGGYIQSGIVNENAVISALIAESDSISARFNDNHATQKIERKAIYDGIEIGKSQPVAPIEKPFTPTTKAKQNIYYDDCPPLPDINEIVSRSNIYHFETGEPMAYELPEFNQPQVIENDDALLWSNGDDLADNAKAPVYMINDILESDSHGILMGASQAYKSFLALELAHCVCTGTDFMNHEVFNSGKVLYVCGEGRGALERRIKALKITKGGFNNNLMVLDTYISIDNLDNLKQLQRLIKAHTPALVVIDTFSSLNSKTNENDNSEVAAVLKAIKESCRNGITSTILVHHFGKDETRGARGAGAFKDNSDFAFVLKRIPNTMQTVLSCEKMKDGDFFDDITMTARVVELGLVRQDGKTATSLVLSSSDETHQTRKKPELTAREHDIFLELNEAIGFSGEMATKEIKERFAHEPNKCPRFVVHVDKWRERAYKVISADKTATKNAAFNRAIDKLVSVGKVGFYDDFYWIVY